MDKLVTTARLAAGLAFGLALAAGPALAEFPEKPIQVIVPAGPGSATDTVTRLVLNKIAEQKSLGQPTVVINVNGGPIAATRVKDATPDGHEIMVYHIGLIGTKAVGKLPFGAEAFEAVAQTGSTRFLVEVVAKAGSLGFQQQGDPVELAELELVSLEEAVPHRRDQHVVLVEQRIRGDVRITDRHVDHCEIERAALELGDQG